MKDIVSICWPKSGMPLFIRESDEEEPKGFDDHSHGCDVEVHAELLVLPTHGAMSRVKSVVEELEESTNGSLLSGGAHSPLAMASRGTASIYRVKGGWAVCRVWPERHGDHRAFGHAFYTTSEVNDALHLFTQSPGDWSELKASQNVWSQA